MLNNPGVPLPPISGGRSNAGLTTLHSTYFDGVQIIPVRKGVEERSHRSMSDSLRNSRIGDATVGFLSQGVGRTRRKESGRCGRKILPARLTGTQN